MRPKQKLEPIFSRQEQSVVYLFSRHWEQIRCFKGKTLLRIQSRFPDCSIVSADGTEEAIEFEYGLTSFRAHLDNLSDLYEAGVRRLYIVYWEHNDETDGLRAEIRKQARFDVVFVCLKHWFQAEVKQIPGTDCWQAFWKFTGEKKQTNPRKAYSLSAIVDATKKLGNSIERLDLDSELYRVLGFDKKGAGFIECDHWEQIRFFTTSTPLDSRRIPCKLFMKPTGCKYFNGYFDIKVAFDIVKSGAAVKQFWKDYYFYEFERYQSDSRCFVCNFKRLEYEDGRDIYKLLHRNNYPLGIRGSITIEAKRDINRIDAILARGDGRSRKRNRHILKRG